MNGTWERDKKNKKWKNKKKWPELLRAWHHYFQHLRNILPRGSSCTAGSELYWEQCTQLLQPKKLVRVELNLGVGNQKAVQSNGGSNNGMKILGIFRYSAGKETHIYNYITILHNKVWQVLWSTTMYVKKEGIKLFGAPEEAAVVW